MYTLRWFFFLLTSLKNTHRNYGYACVFCLVKRKNNLLQNAHLFIPHALGTLLFQFITKQQVPVFLASSFVFIAPISYSVQTWGAPAAMGALFVTGLVYVLIASVVAIRGAGFLHLHWRKMQQGLVAAGWPG